MLARVVALCNTAGLITPPLSSKEVALMRRTILLLSTLTVGLLLASGINRGQEKHPCSRLPREE
jgi:hypothetical protein